MLGLIRKKTLLKKMKEVKGCNRKEDLYAKYPAETEKQKMLNSYSEGYEDGTDNFYNCMKSFISKN